MRRAIGGDAVRHLLELVGYTAAAAEIDRWSEHQRTEAIVYAATARSESAHVRPARPIFLLEPWTGPGGAPTVITTSTSAVEAHRRSR